MKNPLKNISEADRLKALKYTKIGGSWVYLDFYYLFLSVLSLFIRCFT